MIDDYIEKWIIKAVNDLKVAEHELRQSEDEIITDAVCFHCQQAVEKLLKAYLVSKNTDFGKTHNLEFLLESCLKIDPDFKDMDVGNLSFFAVEIRYPDEFYMPSVAEAKECFNIASKFKDFLLKKIS